MTGDAALAGLLAALEDRLRTWREPIAESVRATAADGESAIDDGTAADWLPGIRDEHEDDGGWQARWLDRPTWDRTVTPNIRRRTGQRPTRRR